MSTVNLSFHHPTGTAQVGSQIAVEWRAQSDPMHPIGAAQFLCEYDRSVLRYARLSTVGAVLSMRLFVPHVGFFRSFNGPTSPSTSSPFLGVLFGMLGKENAIKVTPQGVLLGSIIFDVVAAGTADIKLVKSHTAGGVTQPTAAFSGITAGLNVVGTLTGTKVVAS